MKTDLFQSCGHCWVFQICWQIECSTFTASSSRIWNSSTGIPSPPLALFVAMLSKTHLTSHSKMSGSRWMITPSWLSGSLRSFCIVLCQFFCVFLPPLLNIFCFYWSEVKWSEVKSLSYVRFFATSWTVANQAPPSMGFSRQEYGSGLPFPSPGNLPNPGIEPRSPAS